MPLPSIFTVWHGRSIQLAWKFPKSYCQGMKRSSVSCKRSDHYPPAVIWPLPYLSRSREPCASSSGADRMGGMVSEYRFGLPSAVEGGRIAPSNPWLVDRGTPGGGRGGQKTWSVGRRRGRRAHGGVYRSKG